MGDLFAAKLDLSSPPTASSVMGGLKAEDMRIFLEKTANDPLERSHPFAVNDPDMIYFLSAALSYVFRHEVFHIFRAERMKIQFPINRDFYRIILSHFFDCHGSDINNIF